MGKKENGGLVLMAFVATIMVGYSWYVTIYPTEVATHLGAVGAGALMMLLTLLTLALDVLVYLVAVAEGS